MSVKDDIDRILDVFGGADGGAGFARRIAALDKMEQEAAEGKEAARTLLDIVYRFRRLIDVVTRPPDLR